MFIRFFVIALTVATLWWSSSSFGLGFGLGELSLKSYLASPLKASVTLRGMDGIDLDPEYFSIRIDSDSKSKIEYRLQRMDADTAVIDLYTREAISEPLFQFRIEVKWDSSVAMRSYDVLVDPPSYQAYSPTVEKGKTGVNKTPDYEQTGEQNNLATQQPIALSDVVSSDPELAVTTVAATPTGESAGSRGSSDAVGPRREYGPTINGNSIWRVARAVATDNPELTLYQWMYAIWDTNPQAFTRDNMHRLNMDEVLGIPFEDEVVATTHSMAWRAYSSQMSMLQTRIPASDTAKLDVPAEAQQQVTNEVIAQQTDQNIATEVVQVDDYRPVAEQEFEVLAADESLIEALEESAFRFDEESVVVRGIDPDVATQLETVSVAPGTEVETLQSVGVDDLIDTSTMDVGQVDESATSGAIVNESPNESPNESRVALDALDVVAADNQLSTNTVREEVTVGTSSMPVSTPDPELVGWSEALLSRHEFINQLPVIGVGGMLAFVGRAVQQADRYVVTSPSWATLGLGACITVALMILGQQLRARRAAVAAMKLPTAVPISEVVESSAKGRKSAARSAVKPAPKSVSEVPQESVSEAQQKSVSEAQQESVSEAQQESVSEAQQESVSEAQQESVSEAQQESVSEAQQESADQAASEAKPKDRGLTSNAPEILVQANAILAQGDMEEAIKLMRLAVVLQPNQPSLVMLLLELYHKTERAVFFAELMEGSRSMLETLEASDQLRLRSMHARLCPDLPFSFGLNESTDFGELPAGDSSKGNSESDSDYPHFDDDLDDEASTPTHVLFTNNGIPLRDESIPMPSMVGENFDPDLTLKEADVYLAYGLYDSAEELLLKGMELDPGRADFLARLLDSYFATRNITDFVPTAEVMLDMGEAGSEYWEKVEIMGFELAPYNQLFAGGKDGKLNTAELEIAKPQTADFDFSDIADNDNKAFSDFEIEEGGESALADLEIRENDGNDFTAADVNLEQEINELSSSVDDGIDDLDSDLEHLRDAEVSGLADNLADSEDEVEIDLDTSDVILDTVLSECLVATQDDLEAVPAQEIDDDDEEMNLDFEEEEVMQFTMDDDAEPGQDTLIDGDDASLVLVEEPTVDSLASVNLDSSNSRILYFPESTSEGTDIDKLESEFKLTLQVIRDQLQNMTERLFHQERATNDLKQTLAELKDDSNTSKGKKNKKSS